MYSAANLHAQGLSIGADDPKIKQAIESVKSSPKEEVLIVSEPRTFRDPVLKYKRITIRPGGEIIFENSKTNYFVIAAETIQFSDPNAFSLIRIGGAATPDRQGRDGDDGANGRDGRRRGMDGEPGENGRRGEQGKTVHQQPLFLMVKNLEGPEGPLTTQGIRTLGLAIDTTGLRGGDGGRGGKGGYGGRGADGRNAGKGCPCDRGGGDGGRGGNGGNGGDGGDAGMGGNGGDVYLVGDEEITISLSYIAIQTKGGIPGRPGSGGTAGGHGIGGEMGRGSTCCGGGRHGSKGSKGSPGRMGKTPKKQHGSSGKVYRASVKNFEFLD